MKKYIFWMLILSLIGLYIHNYNKSKILSYNLKYEKSAKELARLNSLNQDIIERHSTLVIAALQHAEEDLGLINSISNDYIKNISYNDRKDVFRMIDFIVPSIEALTIK